MTTRQDIQKPAPGAIIELFELDATAQGAASVYRFVNWANPLGGDVVWRGQTYTRYPVEAEGFELSGRGALPRPKLRVANATGLMGALAIELDDLLGARVTRWRTFVHYLDAVNFSGGNPTADSNQCLSRDVWVVDRKSSENRVFVEFELAAPIDVAGVMLPRRQVVATVCAWRYRSAECGYAGGPVADKNDNPTSNAALDACGKRLASCKLRFGATAVLPYGGFPGTRRIG